MTDTAAWFVVVERWDYENQPMLPYVVGPYGDEAAAQEAAEDESGLVYCLLTIDAKNEHYQAVDCSWTDTPPRGVYIVPDTFLNDDDPDRTTDLNGDPT